MKLLLIILFLTVSINLSAQAETDSVAVDPLYLEDQFYLGLTYNFLLNKPQGVTQRNLSYGLMAGFIKDLPLNRRRNMGLGVGIGYSVTSYNSNLLVVESGDGYQYSVMDGSSFKRNKIETHLIEFPLEFRWRNSTAQTFKFWRIYTGLKFAYVLGSRSKFVGDSGKQSFYNTDTNNFQYGLMLNFGYNTFNIHAYYALNDLFQNGTVTTTGESIGITPLRIGIIFYIL